jgi:hypothetical protein
MAMSEIDTSAAAIARIRRLLAHEDGVWRAHADEAEALIGALAGERDALREGWRRSDVSAMDAASKVFSLEAALTAARAEAARLEKAGRVLLGVWDGPHGPGMLPINLARAIRPLRAALAGEPRHD